MFTRKAIIVVSFASLFGCASHNTVSKNPASVQAGKVHQPNSGKESVAKDTIKVVSDTVSRHLKDSLHVQELRKEGIQEWSSRVRSTVEPYWVLPKVLVKHKYRSVARIRSARSGDILNVTWVEKSRSMVFNNLAAKALRKVKHFPPFPTTVPDTVLEIQYEFVTPGISPHRKKLELRKSDEL